MADVFLEKPYRRLRSLSAIAGIYNWLWWGWD
jgi:hypothetical protein